VTAAPRLLIAMTTADRSPGASYVGATLRALAAQGVPRDVLHVFPTDPSTAWLEQQARGVAVTVHCPARRLTRNENGLAAMTGLPRCDWVLHLEDDLVFCAEFVDRVLRWLDQQADGHRGYNLCPLSSPPRPPAGSAWEEPREANGAMAIALRWSDAHAFGRWAVTRLKTWRLGRSTPWRVCGFDVLVREWTGPLLASMPALAQHVGDESLTHRFRHRRIKRSSCFSGPEGRDA
jgi:hypothetical protein